MSGFAFIGIREVIVHFDPLAPGVSDHLLAQPLADPGQSRCSEEIPAVLVGCNGQSHGKASYDFVAAAKGCEE